MPRDGTPTRERLLDVAQKLVLERGFSATSVDAVIAGAGVTKGAFFHHFASKNALGGALMQRYADADARSLETFLAAAEELSDDPAEQLLAFARMFEIASGDLPAIQSGCLFASYVYEAELDGEGTSELIAHSIGLWHARMLELLEAAARTHPPVVDVDLPSLADQVFATFQGGFILARGLGDPTRLRAQLAQLRQYLELLFGVKAPHGTDDVDVVSLLAGGGVT